MTVVIAFVLLRLGHETWVVACSLVVRFRAQGLLRVDIKQVLGWVKVGFEVGCCIGIP